MHDDHTSHAHSTPSRQFGSRECCVRGRCGRASPKAFGPKYELQRTTTYTSYTRTVTTIMQRTQHQLQHNYCHYRNKNLSQPPVPDGHARRFDCLRGDVGDHDVERWWCVGQLQETLRETETEKNRPGQCLRYRRHGGRSVQGHEWPGVEHSDQADEHGFVVDCPPSALRGARKEGL